MKGLISADQGTRRPSICSQTGKRSGESSTGILIEGTSKEWQYPQPSFVNQEARYRPKRYGPVMNVTITKCEKNETNGKWLFQAKDSAGVPVKSENSNEPIWIPEVSLVKCEAGGNPK